MEEWLKQYPFVKRNLFLLTFLAVGVIYLTALLSLPQDSIWISDEGNRIMTLQSYVGEKSKALPDPLTGIENVPEGVRAYPKPYFVQQNGQWRSGYQLFYPYILSYFYALGDRALTWAVPVIAGLLTILCAGFLAKRLLKNEYQASLVMLLCAFGTPLFFYSGTFLETTCSSFLAIASLCCFFASLDSERELGGLFFSGILAGISVLFREESFIFCGAFGLSVLICYFSWRRVIALALGGLLVTLPLLVWNYLDSGSIFGLHSVIYNSLPNAGGNPLLRKLIDYSVFLVLLCLPFLKQLNLVIPFVLVGGIFVCLLPKWRAIAEGIVYGFVILCCAAGIYCNIATEHGGVFIYQSLLDALPLFALCLFSVIFLLTNAPREYRFLTLLSMIAVILPPMFLNHSALGMFWGGRHFLNVIPLLCILTVYLLHTSAALTRTARYAGWILVFLSVAASIAGYGVLSHKRNYSAEFVRTIASSNSKVVVTDIFWMPEELGWIHRDKCILLMTAHNSPEQIGELFKKNGIRDFQLILSKNSRVVSNESLQKMMKEYQVIPGPRFYSPMLSFFEIQIFRVTR